MTLKEFISIEAPRRCEVHQAYGTIALMVFEAELSGEKDFSRDNFDNTRDRAALMLPFKPKNEEEYENCLDVLEYLVLIHYSENHKIDTSLRETELLNKREYSEEEKDLMMARWWTV